MIVKSIFSLCLLSLLTLSAGCGRNVKPQNLSAIERSDTLPVVIKKLVRAVAESDSSGFSRLVAYPLQRPYPLHDVADSRSMRTYYPVLVDDSLRRVLIRSTPADWHSYGWRGWSLNNGEYLWLDDEAVYSVNYVSRRETEMKDSLSRREIASLAPQMRKEGWVPVGCMKSASGSEIFRIDLARNPKDKAAYRLAQYASAREMRSEPERIYSGYMETEGTAMIAQYHFTSADGFTAEYSPDPADGSLPVVEITDLAGSVRDIEVKPAYWLDLLPR